MAQASSRLPEVNHSSFDSQAMIDGPRGKFLDFDLSEVEVDKPTVYNPSTPFMDQRRGALILARMEGLETERSTSLVFDFKTRKVVPEAPVFKDLQDPYYLGLFRSPKIGQYHVIGGVKISLGPEGEITSYQDAFYRYRESILELAESGEEPVPFAMGVRGWKDTRLTQLEDRIAVLPRPQGEFGGLGSIGYFETEDLSSLPDGLLRFAEEKNPESLIVKATETKWFGSNQVIPRTGTDGQTTLDVFGHQGQWVERDGRIRDYDATYFQYNPQTRATSQLQVIATADDFEYVEPKPRVNIKPDTQQCATDLGKVVFTAGITPTSRPGQLLWFGGVGDTKVGVLPIKDPRL